MNHNQKRAFDTMMKMTSSRLAAVGLVLLLTIGHCLGQDVFACDFERDDCSMRQDPDDDGEWLRWNIGTPTASTGPAAAHNGSWYVYVESSSPQQANDELRLATIRLNYMGDVCVEFWYHMYGLDIGSMRVFKQRGTDFDMNGADPPLILWEIHGNQGNQWNQLRIDTVLEFDANRIGWSVIVGPGYRSDIALDDIRVIRDRCPVGDKVPYFCDFESGLPIMCELLDRLDASDQLNWERYDPLARPSNFRGPNNGHDGSRYYLYVPTGGQTGDTAIIETDRLNHDGPVCVGFWYYVQGPGAGTIWVLTSDRGDTAPWLTVEGGDTLGWVFNQITVQLTSDTQVGFRSAQGPGLDSVLALDDITIVSGNCNITTEPPFATTTDSFPWRPVPYMCGFEEGLCGMYQRVNAVEDNFDWTRQTGPTVTQGTGPNAAFRDNYYIYIESSDPRRDGDRAYIETPNLLYSGAACLSFYYHMNGGNIGRLSVFKSNLGESSSLFQRSASEGDTWRQATVDISITYGDRLVLLGERGNGIQGDIAVDELAITPGSCNVQPTPPPTGGEGTNLLTCNFEVGLCDLFNRGDDNFDWTRNRGATPSADTGPSSAPDGGFYLYIEASGRQNADTAMLETPDLRYSGVVCLSFDYHMYGATIGQLRVYTSSRLNQPPPIFSVSGNQGNAWLHVDAETNIFSGDRLVFVGVRGPDYLSDIAIDNIGVKTGTCSGGGGGTNSGVPVQCDFESNLENCGLRQSLSDNFDWTQRSGGTDTTQTGPSRAYQGSFYFYIEASSPRVTNDRAVLETYNVNFEGDICVSFAYHMYGDSMGRLEVLISGNIPIWERSGDQGDIWRLANINTRINFGQQISIVAYRGPDIRSDIAVDSLDIYQGVCRGGPVTPAPTPPPQSSLPFRCSLEFDFCGMFQRPDDSFDWERRSGSTDTADTGPSQAYEGTFYMYIEASNPRTSNDLAIMETGDLNYGGDICVTFAYHMYGNTMGRLEIRTSGSSFPVWERSGDQGNAWRIGNVNTRVEPGQGVAFYAYRGSDIRSDIAVDGIDIYAGTCSTGVTPGPPTSTPGDLPYFCGFETSVCDMSQRTNDQFDWLRRDRATDTDTTGPSSGFDSTWFLYIETSSPRVQGDRAYIATPPLRASGTLCLTFRYHMFGTDIGRLVVFTNNRGEGEPLFSRSGALGENWNYATVVVNGFQFGDTIVFMGERGANIRGDIAIDAVNIQTGQCDGGPPVTPAPPTPGPPTEPPRSDNFGCNFEFDATFNTQCRIRQDRNDGGLDWTLGTGRTPSAINHDRRINNALYPVTGPERAREGNYYLFIEGSGTTLGQKARVLFEGDDFRGFGDKCLRFDFTMNGHHTGDLRVFARYNNGPMQYLWKLSGDQYQAWNSAAVEVKADGLTEIGIEAEMTGEFSSDSALDDIRMTQGRCQPIPSQFIWSCTFEVGGAATWCNIEQPDNKWQLITGDTPSDDTGPGSRGAFNGAYYIYFEASSPRFSGERGSVYIPALQRPGDMCLLFHYNMNGYHMGRLEVYTRDSGSERSVRWTAEGMQGASWLEAVVNLENMGSNEQIAFRAVRGTEYSSDIALDNIRVRQGRC